MPLAIVAILAVVLAAAAVVLDGDDPASAPPLRPAPLAAIIARVERERGLEFRRDPEIVRVSPAQAREEGLASLDEDYPPARRSADEQVLTMLGLLPEGTDLRATAAATYGEAVAGYYDPRSGRMRIVEGAQTGNRVLYEMTVAHELDHALEDQRFHFDLGRLAAGDDPALAYTALIEGSATALMDRYAEGRFSPEETLGGIAASAFAPTGDLPPFLMAQLLFPYTAGERFVSRLLELGGGGWDVVNAAIRFRPPASTEQVLHPQAYVEADQPERVFLARRRGWRVVRGGVLGEWATGQLLARAGGTAAGDAAAGWGGDRYALLARGGPDRAVLARWTWDTPRDAREFRAALRAWIREGLPEGRHAAIDVAWGGVNLAVAATARTAHALAREPPVLDPPDWPP